MKTASYCFSRVFICSIILTSLCMNVCGAAPIEPAGLQSEDVRSMALVSRSDSPGFAFVCAGTVSHGVYIHDTSILDSTWISLGPAGRSVSALAVQHWEDALRPHNTIFAGVSPNSHDLTLIYRRTCDSMNPDSAWVPAGSGLPPDSVAWLTSISCLNSFRNEPPQPCFCLVQRSGASVFRSDLFGSWTRKYSNGGLILNTIKFYRDGSARRVLAGGESGYFQPVFLRSSDLGDTWTSVLPNLGGDNSSYSLAVAPDHPSTVYAGMEGQLGISTDAGLTWSGIGPFGSRVYFLGLVIDPTRPSHILAGGDINSGRFHLYETFDAWSHWTEVSPPPGLPAITALAADTLGGNLCVYIATMGKGIYRYIPDVPADAPTGSLHVAARSALEILPNPIRESGRILYDLDAGGDTQIAIHDVTGHECARWNLGRQKAGPHAAAWSAHGLAPGAYFCTLLRDGRPIATRKAVIVR